MAVTEACRTHNMYFDRSGHPDHGKPLKAGETVYVWRTTSDYKGWVGPGIVVAESDNQRSLWISVRGYLIKASREQVRRATSEESLGVELIKVLSAELLKDIENGRLKNYRDIENQGGPVQDIDDANMDDAPQSSTSVLPTVPEEQSQDVRMDGDEPEEDLMHLLDPPVPEPAPLPEPPRPDHAAMEEQSTRAPTSAVPTPPAATPQNFRRPSGI